MNKYLLPAVIIVLLVAVAGVGYFAMRERNEKNALGASLAMEQQKAMKPKTPSGAPKFLPLMKGAKFSDNPISSKAYLIAPVAGALSKDAQTALTGWTVTSTPNSDGTTTVTLTPKEAEDVQQQFTLKTGYKLYFIEMNLADDATGVDENRGDDMGVLVDDKGMVQ